MLLWLRVLLGATVLGAALGVTESPPTTATAITPLPRPSPSSTPLFSAQLTEEPWFPYRELLLECLVQMSWPCAQRKMIVYLDQLNRARSVSVLGHLVTLVKVREDHVPPITEAQLTARRIDQDQDSLHSLLELAADRFVDTHVLRVNVPSLEAGVLRITPLDVNFVITDGDSEGRALRRTGRGKGGGGGGGDKGGGGMMKKKGGKMMMKMMMMAGKKMMMMMGKMVMVKMMMMVPLAMKKGMIGGMAGMMSMAMMKMMLLQKIISLIKQKMASCGGGGGGGGGGYGGGGSDCGGGGGGGYGGGGGGGGYGGGGGGGGGWDRAYVPNAVQPYAHQYAQNNNQAYVYYYQRPQEENNDGWSLWKRR